LEGRPVSGAVRKFKCPLKKTQPFCPCSSALNWTGKWLNLVVQIFSEVVIDHINQFPAFI